MKTEKLKPRDTRRIEEISEQMKTEKLKPRDTRRIEEISEQLELGLVQSVTKEINEEDLYPETGNWGDMQADPDEVMNVTRGEFEKLWARVQQLDSHINLLHAKIGSYLDDGLDLTNHNIHQVSYRMDENTWGEIYSMVEKMEYCKNSQ